MFTLISRHDKPLVTLHSVSWTLREYSRLGPMDTLETV